MIKLIISASRRTDIPAFYAEWFMNRVRDEKVIIYNPYNKLGQEISLSPEDVDVIVFWSKNYGPLLNKLDELKDKYRLYFLFTITGLKGILEENVIDPNIALEQFINISSKFSPEHIQWRFDPIVLTNVTEADFYIKKFTEIAKKLYGYTHRCYISFANIYTKVLRNFEYLEKVRDIKLLDKNMIYKKEIAERLADIGEKYDIKLYSCCNDFLISDRISKASCIDAEYLNRLFNINIKSSKSPTRKQCGCYKSVDIGVYNTCPNGCYYCYANYNRELAVKNYNQHNPESMFLLNKDIELIKRLPDRKCESKQISIFDMI